MNKKSQTINSYDKNAKLFANKFDSFGARIEDIEETFALVKKDNPHVFEIGHGNGRDAVEIVKRTDNYLGIDLSEKLTEIARQKAPTAKFEIADVEKYTFPKNLDIIFAFTSLIHVSKESLQEILNKSHSALNDGGVVRLSMKHGENYAEKLKEDNLGTRTNYLYSKKDIEELSDDFEIIKSELRDLRNQTWLEIILKKR